MKNRCRAEGEVANLSAAACEGAAKLEENGRPGNLTHAEETYAVRSRNSDVRQLRLPSTVGGGKEPPFRSTAMEQNLSFQRRPATLSASPLGSETGNRHLHTPHAATRHSARMFATVVSDMRRPRFASAPCIRS